MMHLIKTTGRKLGRLMWSGQGYRQALLKKLPKNAVCAEIGVWKGDFSQIILKTTVPVKLHLIDPWTFQKEFPGRMYGGGVAKNQADMDGIFEGVKERFRNDPRIVVNRGKSADRLPEFPDHYFDWVYIDGNHYYDFVLQDLKLSLKKVKPGGMIAGDDFNWGREANYPVRRAVEDFVELEGLNDRLEVMDSQFLIRLKPP